MGPLVPRCLGEAHSTRAAHPSPPTSSWCTTSAHRSARQIAVDLARPGGLRSSGNDGVAGAHGHETGCRPCAQSPRSLRAQWLRVLRPPSARPALARTSALPHAPRRVAAFGALRALVRLRAMGYRVRVLSRPFDL